MNYQAVMGLEIHVELNTKSKMFCRCSADYFGKEPNSQTCPTCLGLPGALPYINEKAIESCIKIGLALNCIVSAKSIFERKNYFYPDLPKGYQISQYRWPLCKNGQLKIEGGKSIRINRVHQEEDTGKLFHKDNATLIDFNRSGVPLVEIVTEPDFTDTKQVVDYAKKLQQLLRTLGVSNADMERGDMRLEANVSVRPELVEGLPNYRVELKNINSFRFMSQAIEYEIKRQIEALEKGEKLYSETRGWDQEKKKSILQRTKEEAHDYRYFPEPDLPELRIDQKMVEKIKSEMPELPLKKVERFVSEFGITQKDAEVLVYTSEMSDVFERAVEVGLKQNITPKQIANLMINRKNELSPDEIVKEILNKSVGVIGDAVELEKLAKEVIIENQRLVETYKAGKLTVIQALIGQVMRKSGGKADSLKVKEILEKLLS